MVYSVFVVFFFKQKTAYEMRISDWSSDVCSSDLDVVPCRKWLVGGNGERVAFVAVGDELEQGAGLDLVLADVGQIVEHDEIELVELVENGGQAEVAARGLELLDHVGGGAEQDAPPRVDEGMANRSEGKRVGKECVSPVISRW